MTTSPSSRGGPPPAARPTVAAVLGHGGPPEARERTARCIDRLVEASEQRPSGAVVLGTFDEPSVPACDHVLVLGAGFEPTSADLDGLVVELEGRHVSALALATVGEDGSAQPQPTSLSFTGHVLPACSTGGTPTVVLGDAFLVRHADLERVGGFDSVASTAAAAAIDLGWRLWTGASGAVLAATHPLSRPNVVDDVASPAAVELDALRLVQRNFAPRAAGPAIEAALQLLPRRAPSIAAEVTAAFHRERGELTDEQAVRGTRRMRPDIEVVPVLDLLADPDHDDPAFVAAYDELVPGLASRAGFDGRLRIVVATRDALAPRMAGPGIRALHLALALAGEHDVRLVSELQADLEPPEGVAMRIERYGPSEVVDLVEWCDVFVFQGSVMSGQQCFERTDRIFVVDIYDPMHLEQLEQAKDHADYERRKAVNAATRTLNEQLLRGDWFMCASEKQRDFWLGHLASLGRINPVVYDRDETLRRQIDVVAFGIPDEPPVATRHAIKGTLPGVGPDDRVVLWGGGVYNWFDPLTLIRAVDLARRDVPDLRLVFLGMRHPNPEIPEMRMAVAARDLAAELGLAGTHVIFNEQWVAYEDRHNYLLDSDVAVTTHLHHVETEFAYRTRVLDYLWAGLPTIATSGDALADLIDRHDLGITVAPDDVEALRAALVALLTDPERAARCRTNIEDVLPSLRWSTVTRPLVEFCRSPQRAPDLVAGVVDRHGVMGTDPPQVPTWRRYVQVVSDLVRRRDGRALVRRAKGFVRRRVTRPS